MSIKILNTPSEILLAQTLTDLINRDGKLTPASLARKLGIPANKITRILNGDVTDPKASTLLQIANCFDITIDQLLGLEPIVKKGEYGELSASQILPVFNISNIDNKTPPIDWYRWVENTTEGNYFSVSIDNDLYEPTFPKGAILIINPDLEPDDRSFILVKKKNNQNYCNIKKYVVDGEQYYLYPINPKLPIETYDKNKHDIIGLILEVHQKLKNKH